METFKKSDLKTGYIIELRNGNTGLIVKNNCYGEDAIIYSESSWTDLGGDGYDENLNWVFLKNTLPNGNDIIKVYKPDLPTGFLGRKSKFSDEMELIWERKEEKTICTIDGVEYSESTLRSMIKKATS